MDQTALPVRKVARLLNVSTCTVYRAIEHGQLASFRLGKRIFVLKATLDAVLAQGLPHSQRQFGETTATAA